MTWYYSDDGLHSDPRYIALKPRLALPCMGLRHLIGTWCARHETDGRIPTELPRQFRATPAQIDELVRVGFWTVEEGYGWLMNDWSTGNRTREQASKERQETRERVSKLRQERKSQHPETPVTSIDPELYGRTTENVREAVRLPMPYPSLPSPVSPSEKPPPPQPSTPPRSWTGGIFADDPDIEAAAERWAQTPGKVAMLAGAKLAQLRQDHSHALAEWVLRRALTDPDTRTLGRLDSDRVPGYLPDLLRQGRTALSAADRAPGAPRCMDHPENPARTCGACKGDIKAGQRDPADQGRRNSREDVAV